MRVLLLASSVPTTLAACHRGWSTTWGANTASPPGRTCSENNCHTEFGKCKGAGYSVGLPNGMFGIPFDPDSNCGTRSQAHNANGDQFYICEKPPGWKQDSGTGACGQQFCLSNPNRNDLPPITARVTDVCPSNHPDRWNDCNGKDKNAGGGAHCTCVTGSDGDGRGVDISYDANLHLGGNGDGPNLELVFCEGPCSEVTEYEFANPVPLNVSFSEMQRLSREVAAKGAASRQAGSMASETHKSVVV